jgi:DNA-binding LacI/PurR family transcriptional regulator
MEDEELYRCLALLGRACPVVSMCHIRTRPGVVKVSGSFPAQAKAAVDHFRQQGLRSIAMLRLADLDPKQAQDFLNITRPISGVQSIFVEVVDPVRLDDQEQPVEPVSQEMANWFRRLPKPSGVFCAEMGGGGYAIRVCHALGLRVPEDIAVIGSDDTDVTRCRRRRSPTDGCRAGGPRKHDLACERQHGGCKKTMMFFRALVVWLYVSVGNGLVVGRGWRLGVGRMMKREYC